MAFFYAALTNKVLKRKRLTTSPRACCRFIHNCAGREKALARGGLAILLEIKHVGGVKNAINATAVGYGSSPTSM